MLCGCYQVGYSALEDKDYDIDIVLLKLILVYDYIVFSFTFIIILISTLILILQPEDLQHKEVNWNLKLIIKPEPAVLDNNYSI